jgi:hypothetical protein
MIRRPSGWKKGGEVRSAVIGDLADVAAVGVHDEELHAGGADQMVAEELAVLLQFSTLGVVGAVDDLLPVEAEEGAAVVAWSKGQAAQVGAIQRAGVKLQVTVSRGGKDDAVAGGG